MRLTLLRFEQYKPRRAVSGCCTLPLVRTHGSDDVLGRQHDGGTRSLSPSVHLKRYGGVTSAGHAATLAVVRLRRRSQSTRGLLSAWGSASGRLRAAARALR